MSTRKPTSARAPTGRTDVVAEQRQLGEQLLEIEKLLKQVGILYNQYFAGSLKMPPNQLRLQVERMLRELTQETIRNASIRNKYQNLQAMYASMQTLWTTKLRERENRSRRPTRVAAGSSRVDRFSEKRVRSFLGDRARKKKSDDPAAAGDEPTSAAAAASEPPSPPTGDASQSSVHQLWDRIAHYQMSAGQPLTFESPETLARYLTVQKSKIEQKTGVKGVQLKIAIEDGKLKVKAKMPGEATGSVPGDPVGP